MKWNRMMWLALVVLIAGNTGCYYDQWAQAQRRNGVLEEELTRAKADLADAQNTVARKETEIDGLNKRIIAKDEMNLTLQAEAESLRSALAKAQQILENWQPPAGTTVFANQPALPAPLHNKLVEFAKAHPGLLVYDEAKGAVRWKGDLLFPSGQDVLVSQGEVVQTLKEFAAIAGSPEAAGYDVVVVGHTDTDRISQSNARFQSNWDLSAYRAIAVMKLLARSGLSETRMGVMGYSKFRPIADNASDAGKGQNRRVEIYLVESGSVQSVSQGVRVSDALGLAWVSAPLAR